MSPTLSELDEVVDADVRLACGALRLFVASRDHSWFFGDGALDLREVGGILQLLDGGIIVFSLLFGNGQSQKMIHGASTLLEAMRWAVQGQRP